MNWIFIFKMLSDPHVQDAGKLILFMLNIVRNILEREMVQKLPPFL